MDDVEAAKNAQSKCRRRTDQSDWLLLSISFQARRLQTCQKQDQQPPGNASFATLSNMITAAAGRLLRHSASKWSVGTS